MKIDGPHFLHHIIAGAFQISRVFIGVTTHFKVRNYIEAEVHLEDNGWLLWYGPKVCWKCLWGGSGNELITMESNS